MSSQNVVQPSCRAEELLGSVHKAKRESNIELFRILVMLLIVAHHYVVNSELYNVIQEEPLCLRSVFLLLFGAWGKTGINYFVLVTGYFMCRSQLTARKYAKLLLEILFYKIIIYFFFSVLGYEELSFSGILRVLMPIADISNGFTSCYLVFMLFIPLLNILVDHMTERNHLYLLVVCTFVYVVLGTLPIVNVFFPWFPAVGVTMNYLSWFVVLYFIGAYIRIYPKELFQKTRVLGCLLVLFLMISVVSVVCCAYISYRWGWVQIGFSYYFLSDANKVLAVLVAVCAFLFSRSLKIPYNKRINKVSASTFGVLLIHANSDAMRRFLWVDVLQNGQMFHSVWMSLHAIGCVLAVFSICSCIDFLRIQFVETPFFQLWDKLSVKLIVRRDS